MVEDIKIEEVEEEATKEVEVAVTAEEEEEEGTGTVVAGDTQVEGEVATRAAEVEVRSNFLYSLVEMSSSEFF